MIKNLIRRWLAMPSRPDIQADKLALAKDHHISDLRVLLDKANAREDRLAHMVEMVMEERYFRPVVTGKPTENRTTAAIAPEHLQDVATFDEQSDQEQSDAEGVTQQELQQQLDELLAEHAEAHA